MSNLYKQKLEQLSLGYLLKDIWYRLDWTKPNPSSVKQFLIDNVMLLKRFDLPMFVGNNDKVIIKILRWVINNFNYEIDEKRFSVIEKWQTVQETLAFEKGDCEDGGVLIYCMARLHGISPTQIKLTTGFVDLNGKKIGHCWIEYLPDFEIDMGSLAQWYTIDWCYHPDISDLKLRVHKDTNKYLSEWFSVTDFQIN